MKTHCLARISSVLILSLLFMMVSALPGMRSETQSLAASKYYKVQIKVGKKSFDAKLKKNKTTKQLVSRMPFTVNMKELNGNEKYHYFDDSFITNAKTVKKIKAGDIKLYGDNCLVIFYKSFKSGYDYTNLGKITKTKGLAKALGKGNVKVKFKLKG